MVLVEGYGLLGHGLEDLPHTTGMQPRFQGFGFGVNGELQSADDSQTKSSKDSVCLSQCSGCSMLLSGASVPLRLFHRSEKQSA